MSIKKTSILVTSAVLIALGSVSANAATSGKQQASKELKIGMATGATAGAFIGGPFGAAIGFMVGALVGGGAGDLHAAEKEAVLAKNELVAAQTALTELAATQAVTQKPIEKTDDAIDTTLDQLAQQLRADVLFRTGSAELDSSAVTKLGDLGAVLGKYPKLTIDIDGYADPRGKADENLELSQQRALAVRSALIVGGALPDNIHTVAHGEQLSVAAKNDMEGYAWERRASLSVSTSTPSALAQTK